MLTITDQLRPVLVAALLAALVVAGTLLTDPTRPALTPSIDFGGGAAAAETDEVPEWLAHLPACDVDRAWSTCPATLPPTADSVGWINPEWGRADGWLAPGGVDRFDLTEPGATLTIRLEGDRGAVLGVYAGGEALLDPADGYTAATSLTISQGIELVQVAVVNPTDARRQYQLRID